MQIYYGVSFKKLCFNKSKQQTFTIKYNQREIAEKKFLTELYLNGVKVNFSFVGD